MNTLKLTIAALMLLTLEASSAETVWEKNFDLSYRTKKVEYDPTVLAEYQSGYAKKIDFAKLENEKPLSREFLNSLTEKEIFAMDQEMADQLYARLTAGPIPEGIYDGHADFLKGSGFLDLVKAFTGENQNQETMSWLGRIKAKIKKDVNLPTGADLIALILRDMTNMLWKGKEFNKAEGTLRNIIPVNTLLGVKLALLVDGFNPFKLPTYNVTIQHENVQTWKLFPAKLYCGQSLLDSRRESVLIDYAYSDTIKQHYYAPIDFLASRHGIYVRDEIRMIRPGFYLGRAYIGRMFFLTFTLHNEQVDQAGRSQKEWKQDCWTGTQKLANR